jgi:bacillithiol biosynthesis cysteine-adding enzyme BshC
VVVDYESFQEPPTALFRDYLKGEPRVRPFYDGGGFGWDLERLSASADRSLTLPRPRRALAEALAAQQQRRGADAAAERAAQLADEGTAAVVTGQQPVLFGGPLYVLYKATAAVKLASLLESRRGRPVVPVFWAASEDHDFAEVRSVPILDESGRIRTLRYEPAREPVGQPASRIVLDETIAGLVAEAQRSLPAGLHRDETIALLSECYRPGTTLAAAFARLVSSIVPGLVVLDPSDPALKAHMAPVLAREIREASPTSRLAEAAGQSLLAAGYHQQVPIRPGFLNLFVMMEGERRALGSANGMVEVRGLGRKMPVAEAVRLLESDPTPWSPGVLLRPLAQDQLLPTAAYVGGPAEIAYHAQIGPSYAHFGIPRPALVPRPSLTLVEPAQARALEAEGLELWDLQADPEAVLLRWAREAHPRVEAAFARTRETLEREMAEVEEALAALDPTLRAAADSARGRALHQIESLHEKSVRALKKKDQSRADRLRRTRDALLPGGSFQERGLGLLSLLARYGTAVVGEVRERMDVWAKGHQVIQL